MHIMLKRLVIIAICLFSGISVFAQIQHGFVKTKGRLDSQGNLISGKPLDGVMVRVQHRTDAISDRKGNFSFPMPDQTFSIEKVAKNGYVLTDADILGRHFPYTEHEMVITMEPASTYAEERLENFAKINEAQQNMISQLREEVKNLKEENKITEEEYLKRLQNLFDMQTENSMLVEEMADRYSKIDYDQISELDRQIRMHILSGDLAKADALVNSKGDISQRVNDLKELDEANAKMRTDVKRKKARLAKREALAMRERDALAYDFYYKYELYRLKHDNDSALYYLEQRRVLDTLNLDWLTETADFLKNYMADYDKAMEYYRLCADIAIAQFGERSQWAGASYFNIGTVYWILGDYDNAFLYHERALKIREDILGINSPETAMSYNDLGILNSDIGNYEKAMELYEKALSIFEKCETEINQLASAYNNLGVLYIETGDYDKAVEYLQRAFELWKLLSGEESPNVANAYNSMAIAYVYKGDFIKSLENMEKSVNLFEMMYGEEHPDVAIGYINLGEIYSNLGHVNEDMKYHDKAYECFEKALSIREKIFGKDHPEVAVCYNYLGMHYGLIGENEKALEYLKKSVTMRLNFVGEEDINIARSYINMIQIYKTMGDDTKAEEYYNKALTILRKYMPEDHPEVEYVKSLL